jgi:5-methylcytosine-specific restriction endonuclease McrA
MAAAIIPRQEARKQGLSRYFTGKPCKKGHFVARITRSGQCTECLALWRVANRSRIQLSQKKYVVNNIEKLYECRKRWTRDNPDKDKVAHQKWSARNPEKVRASGRRWGAKYPDKVAAKSARRRARLLKSGENYTASDLREIMALQKGKCAYCKTLLQGRRKCVDHIIPLAGGGGNERRNIQFLCEPCNLKKSNLDPLLFARKIGYLI